MIIVPSMVEIDREVLGKIKIKLPNRQRQQQRGRQTTIKILIRKI